MMFFLSSHGVAARHAFPSSPRFSPWAPFYIPRFQLSRGWPLSQINSLVVRLMLPLFHLLFPNPYTIPIHPFSLLEPPYSALHTVHSPPPLEAAVRSSHNYDARILILALHPHAPLSSLTPTIPRQLIIRSDRSLPTSARPSPATHPFYNYKTYAQISLTTVRLQPAT